ncbi:permease for cytosine/purines, uracil, thiamine, allantoin-domain-containing protein [Dactylonectria estremocensis]|uniref:Permease for cytosine/purines, uracil, thiamine, allantoin-domain-containing protein n=1 Tax=Dactylonectria estremocensis TaxID=1079267 RepID=A0A9P9IZL1_9HYPO|nr:permease for cytosine/purines, uracil, thiamine, allantoin-domain-containing protein [Dactylonectria estremocensis]
MSSSTAEKGGFVAGDSKGEVASSLDNHDTSQGQVDAVSGWRRAFNKAATFGRVELRGIQPIPVEERTDTQFVNVFTIWWCMNANLLPITFGMLGPIYGLGLRDSSLVIIFFTLLTTLLPSYLGTMGPKTGMRQMIQARFSWGRYLVAVPVLFNLATLTGFCVIMAVIGGQCLSAVGNGHLSPTVGIVIVSLLSLFISFSGFKVLHIYERWAWIPAIIAIIIATGTGGKHLHEQVPTEPATAPSVLSFGMIVASYMIPWACLASDFTTYLTPTVSSKRLFVYAYTGLAVPTILLMILGAAIGGAVANVPAWSEGYDANLVGGALAGMLKPAGGFGKFVVVILSFSLLGNIAATSYSVTLNFQLLIPQLIKVPRYVFAVLITIIVIPVSIRASTDFFVNLENFIALIGYWASAFLGVVIVEHLWFRKADCSSYSLDAWNDAKQLPLGVAALAATVLCFGLVVPSMSQVWFTGPIAEKTGDIGFELAFVVSGLLYVPFRTLEKKMSGR